MANTRPNRHTRWKLAGAVLAGALTLMTILAGAGTAQAASRGGTPTAAVSAFAPIKNLQTGQCVRPEVNAEAQLRMAVCNAGDLTQNWIFVSKSNGFHIVNQLSGLCIYMNGPVASGSPVIQTDCTTVSNEDWQPGTAPPAVTTIVSKAGFRNTNLCLTPDAGGLVRINTCAGRDNQRWVIGVPNR